MTERGQRHGKTEVRQRAGELLQRHATVIQIKQIGAPGNQRSYCNSNKARWHAAKIAHATKPAQQNNHKAHDADHRCHVHFQRRAHRDERQ